VRAAGRPRALLGFNVYGQLGNNTNSTASTPQTAWTTVSTPLANLTEVAAGYNHTCALRNDGTVWCWGYNGNGELGMALPARV
jgi:alpha-tubulin suppressor-like RCC1 family protein